MDAEIASGLTIIFEEHCNMEEHKDKKLITKRATRVENPEGYPLYPESEDIFEKSKQEKDIDPNDINKTKQPVTDNELRQKDIDDIVESEKIEPDDLDVPGAELDDEDEEIGNEDEENNYYSLGGSKHDD